MSETEIVQKSETNQKICPRWHVLLLNDDFHSMDFVVILIMNVFKKNDIEAIRIMAKIHEEGQAIVITVSKERAELYLEQVSSMHEGELGPLNCTIEPAE
jgi:ATP-dependent Clp protease adaptor protein ClpS